MKQSDTLANKGVMHPGGVGEPWTGPPCCTGGICVAEFTGNIFRLWETPRWAGLSKRGVICTIITAQRYSHIPKHGHGFRGVVCQSRV